MQPLSVVRHGQDLVQAFVHESNDPQWTYLAYGPYKSDHEFLTWLESVQDGEDPLFHTIIDGSSGTAIGLAGYLRIEPDNGVIEVGHIHYSPRLQKSRSATEAMFLMMQRVFDELGYRRYEWKCDALNAPSRAAAERLGFAFEGIFRQATMYKGRNRDTAWYSIIDTEWPQIKQGFEQWLEPANFDEEGNQKVSLSNKNRNRS